MSGQLEIITGVEADRLAVLKEVIDRGVQTFIDVGNALAEIRYSRLYRQSHGRFEDYLRERWDMSERSRGYQLIDAAGVARQLVSTMVDTDDEEDLAAQYGFEVVAGSAGEASRRGRRTVAAAVEREGCAQVGGDGKDRPEARPGDLEEGRKAARRGRHCRRGRGDRERPPCGRRLGGRHARVGV